MIFLLVKWIHVLAAMTAVGANATYGIWMARARREPSVLPFVVHNIKRIDDRIANPLYVLLLLTGLTMALTIRIPLNTPWLMAALILYAIATILGMAVFVPIFRRQIQLLETEGMDSPRYQAAFRQATVSGLVVGLAVLMITFLMVVKPPLWS